MVRSRARRSAGGNWYADRDSPLGVELSRVAQGGSDDVGQELRVLLAKSLELVERNSKLTQELEKQRRADLTERNRDGTTIRMIPPFVAPCLAGSRESKLSCGILKLARSCA